MIKLEKLRNFALGVVAAAILLSGCANEAAINTGSTADNGDSHSDASVNQSDVSADISDTSIESSLESSDGSSNTSEEASKEEDNSQDAAPAVKGEYILNELNEYAIGIYARQNDISYEEASELFPTLNRKWKSFGVGVTHTWAPGGYNQEFGADMINSFIGTKEYTCIVLRFEYEGDDEENEEILPEGFNESIQILWNDPALIAICKKMGITLSNLSELRFTAEEIAEADGETAQLLLNLINATKKYTLFTTKDNKKSEKVQSNVQDILPNITGEEVIDQLDVYVPGIYLGILYPTSLDKPYAKYEEAAKLLEGVKYETFGIDVKYNYDPSLDAGTSVCWDGNDMIDCVVLGVTFKDDLGEQIIRMYIPADDPAMVAICEKMGVAPNNLSALKFTAEEILALDGETAGLLWNLINATKNFTLHKTPANQLMPPINT